jgi:hypothetical protein
MGIGDFLWGYSGRDVKLTTKPDEINEFLFNLPLLPAALGPGVHSASNRNEYLKQKNNVSGE